MARGRSNVQDNEEPVEVGSWIKVYWDGDDKWYRAEVTELDPVTELCKVLYEDGEREEFRLSEVEYLNISGDKMKEQEEAEDEGVYSKKSLRYVRLTLVDMADRLPEAAVRKDCRQWWDTWQRNVTGAADVHNFDGLKQLTALLGEQINVEDVEEKVDVTTDWWKTESTNWRSQLAGCQSYGDLACRVRELLLKAVDWTTARNLFPPADSETDETSGTESEGEKDRKRKGRSLGRSTTSSALSLIETDSGNDGQERQKRRRLTYRSLRKARYSHDTRKKKGYRDQASEEGCFMSGFRRMNRKRKLVDRTEPEPLDVRLGEDSEIIEHRLLAAPITDVSGARVVSPGTPSDKDKVQVPVNQPRRLGGNAWSSGNVAGRKKLRLKKKRKKKQMERADELHPQDTGQLRSGNWGKNSPITEAHFVENKRGKSKQIPLVSSVAGAHPVVDRSTTCPSDSSPVMEDRSDFVASRGPRDGHQLVSKESPAREDPKVAVSAMKDTVGCAPPKVSVLNLAGELPYSKLVDKKSKVKKKPGRPRKIFSAHEESGSDVGISNQADSERGAGAASDRRTKAQEYQEQERVPSGLNMKAQSQLQLKPDKKSAGSEKKSQRRKPGRPRKVLERSGSGSESNGGIRDQETGGKRHSSNKMLSVERVHAVKPGIPGRPRKTLLPVRAFFPVHRGGILRSASKTAESSGIVDSLWQVKASKNVDDHQLDQGANSSTSDESAPIREKLGGPRKSATYMALMSRRQLNGATSPSASKSITSGSLVSYKRRRDACRNGPDKGTEAGDENKHVQAGNELVSPRREGKAACSRSPSSRLPQEEKVESVIGTLRVAANAIVKPPNPVVSGDVERKYYRRSFRKSPGRPPKKVGEGECQESATCASLSAAPQSQLLDEHTSSGGLGEKLSIQVGQCADGSPVDVTVAENGNETPPNENMSAASCASPSMSAPQSLHSVRLEEPAKHIPSPVGGSLQHNSRSDRTELRITSEGAEARGAEQIQNNEAGSGEGKKVGDNVRNGKVKDTTGEQSLQITSCSMSCETVPSASGDNSHRNVEAITEKGREKSSETEQKLDTETARCQGEVVETVSTGDTVKDTPCPQASLSPSDNIDCGTARCAAGRNLQLDGRLTGSEEAVVENEIRGVREMEQDASHRKGLGVFSRLIISVNKSSQETNIAGTLKKSAPIEDDTPPILPSTSVAMQVTGREVGVSELEHEQPPQVRTCSLQDGDASASEITSDHLQRFSGEKVSSVPWTSKQMKSASAAEEACVDLPVEKCDSLITTEEMQVESQMLKGNEQLASTDVPWKDAEHNVEPEYPSWGEKLCSDSEDETGTSPVCGDVSNHNDGNVGSFQQENLKPQFCETAFSLKLSATEKVGADIKDKPEDVKNVTPPVDVSDILPERLSQTGKGNFKEPVKANTTPVQDKGSVLVETVCNICELMCVEDHMLRCENGSCTCSIHTFCLNPPLQVVPADTWTCLHCSSATENNTVTKCRPLAFPPKKIQGVIGRRSSMVKDEVKRSERSKLEYLVKWDGLSHWHDTWIDAAWFVGERERIVSIFKSRHPDVPKLDVTKGVDNTVIDERKPKWLLIDRVIKCRENGVGQLHPSELSRVGYNRNGVQFLVKWQGLNYRSATWEETKFSKDMREAIRAFISRHEAAELDLSHSQPVGAGAITRRPKYIHGGSLYGYQVQGLKWLVQSFEARRNVVLADERLLGKTVQAVAFIACIRHQQLSRKPVLVVASKSALSEWEKELKFWGPNLNTVVYQGEKDNRDVIQMCEFHTETGRPLFEVLLTSYELAIADSRSLCKFHWAAVIVDENIPQQTRNMLAQIGGALKKHQSEFRLLLTSSPVLNSLDELPSLFHFLDPVEFPKPDVKAGTMRSVDGVGADSTVSETRAKQLAKLHELLKSRMLRRVKIDIPRVRIAGKKIVHVPCSLTPFQRKLYTAVLDRNFQLLNKFPPSGVKRSVNAIITELKMLCNHPYIFPENKPQVSESEDMSRRLVEVSGKLLFLEKLLPLLKEEGHRVLLVSQMTKVMDIIEDFLRLLRLSFIRIDESTSAAQREKDIEQFDRPECTDFIMLISAGAGGLGINLRSADTVIIYDPYFSQAQLRALRIGQDQTVLVYRLFTEGSVEEKHIETQGTLESTNSGSKDLSQAKESASSYISEVLLHGLDKVDDEHQVAARCSEPTVESLQELLDRSGAEPSPVVRDDYDCTLLAEKRGKGYGEKWRELLARLLEADEKEEAVVNGGPTSRVKNSVEQRVTAQVNSDCPEVGREDHEYRPPCSEGNAADEGSCEAEESWSDSRSRNRTDRGLDVRQDRDVVNVPRLSRHSGLHGEVPGRNLSPATCPALSDHSQTTQPIPQVLRVSSLGDVRDISLRCMQNGKGGSHSQPGVPPRPVVSWRVVTTTGAGFDRVPSSEGIGIHLNSLLPTATRNMSSEIPLPPPNPGSSTAVFAEPTLVKQVKIGSAAPGSASNRDPVTSVSRSRTNRPMSPEVSSSNCSGAGMSKCLEVAGSGASNAENLRENLKSSESSVVRTVQSLVPSGSDVLSGPAPHGDTVEQPAILCRRRRAPINLAAVASTTYVDNGHGRGPTDSTPRLLTGLQNLQSGKSLIASSGVRSKSDIAEATPRHSAFTQLMRGQIAACSSSVHHALASASLKKTARNRHIFRTVPSGNHLVAVMNARNRLDAAAPSSLSADAVSSAGRSQASQAFDGATLGNESAAQLKPSEPLMPVRSCPPVSSYQATDLPQGSASIGRHASPVKSRETVQIENAKGSSNPTRGGSSTTEDGAATNKGLRKPLWVPKGDAGLLMGPPKTL
ncbi:hypothetical protein R1sor_012560 [Riccia sorocarpa]|uniref:Uncharacterized protein n=1 Tax=Riccia sorocarpa TaxID=122646 RepID=A0ABD3I609_9MARC